ncbi:methyltransferase domain-containing protein [Acidianus sulfidivorans JP7]|uniref:SAM-dependent methyltransferase n=1 Tax=Acidianus sulfidivorans JP7 TaxID=619593 RepID=A0A2U9IKK6_9CREN|nr:methyltransferase domain-containing protein [Acidianus sulfidivorans]AWR96525.1 methyltransferase domain-containing protein [Acidianus sulfidivorans JP7]
MEIFNDPEGYASWYKRNWKIYQTEANAVKKLELSNCLDIGSGPSIFHEAINGEKISLDLSEFMLKNVESNEEKVQAHALYLPFRDKAIPCTFISVTICFIDDIDSLIKEIKRVTKSVFSVCFIPRDSPWGEYYENLGKKGHKYYSRAHFISKGELLKTIQKYFKIVEILSTLTYSPNEEEKIEEPSKNDNGSYVCIKAFPLE